MPSPYAALHQGLVVASKYRLVEVCGEGAMGAVWSANHLTLGHTVAIKFLNVSTAGSPQGRARFEREAKIAARLGEASRHICRVIDHGVLDDGMPYIVMELLHGESLSAYLKHEKVVPLARIARVVQHLARALQVAHAAGVVHRDLKPANIFLCQPEPGEELYVKLLDFGIAKATEASDDEGTGNALLGTPSYMSPEQLSDGVIDARTDLWAVAAIVYRMACGRPPFGGGPIGEVGFRIVSSDPAPPSQVQPELPAEFDAWTTRALSKRADDRFQTAAALSEALTVIAGLAAPGEASSGALRAAAVPVTDGDASSNESRGETQTTNAGAAASVGAETSVDPPTRKPRAGPLAAVLGACALVLLLALVRRPSTPPVERPVPLNAATPVASSPVPSGPTAPLAVASSPVPSGPTAPLAVASSPVPSGPTPSPAAASPSPSPSMPASASASAVPASNSSAKGTTKKKPDASGWGNKKEL